MPAILLLYTSDDTDHLWRLKGLVGANKTYLSSNPPLTVAEVALFAKQKGLAGVATTQLKLLRKLLEQDVDCSRDVAERATLDDYAGSVIKCRGTDFLILNPLEHLRTVPSAPHLFARYLSKLFSPQSWWNPAPFSYEVVEHSGMERAFADLACAEFIAVDIETLKKGLRFDCISFTGVWLHEPDAAGNLLRLHTYTFKVEDEYSFCWVKRICEETEGAKIFQNGKYDNAYLLRFGICTYNWLWDTANLFHSWYSELPKRLDFIASYCLRDSKFWKNDAAGAGATYADRLRYNARDTHNTACCFLRLMQEMPAWALKNYEDEFPLVFPCLLSEMTGLGIDTTAFGEMKKKLTSECATEDADLRRMIPIHNFNAKSGPDVLTLFKALGSADIKTTEKTGMDRFKSRHPLNEYLGEAIETNRKKHKMLSSYLKDRIFFTDNNGIATHPRVLYQLNPHGTDTSRLASAEHHFWCGLQIHNIPRDSDKEDEVSFKDCIVADDGFFLGEVDYRQAEARDTGYLSGDTAYIAAVDGPNDFHSVNASAFFGVPYEQIFNNELDKTLDKTLRDLSKRTNHGANYNMKKRMLLMTMGVKRVMRAKVLLKLPRDWSLERVCEYLLERFDETYPLIRGLWQERTRYQIKTTHMLVGPTGLTRWCFDDPEKNPRAINAYMAHQSQSLNAQTLNKAYKRVFYEVALPNVGNFKMACQIHDSILFQYRIGHLHLAHQVAECMLMDTPVVDCKGITRILRVPVDLKAEARAWSELKKVALRS